MGGNENPVSSLDRGTICFLCSAKESKTGDISGSGDTAGVSREQCLNVSGLRQGYAACTLTSERCLLFLSLISVRSWAITLTIVSLLLHL